MGLFDIFKKVKQKENKEQNEQNEQIYKQEQQNEPQLPFEVFFSSNPNGTMQVDFYDKHPSAKQFYDTTRLVVDPRPMIMGNSEVLNAAVSWYGKNDAIVLDNSGNESGRRTIYRGILTQIDLNLLQTDANYCQIVMKDLLSQERVEKYLNQGMEENPEKPCGKYIGGVEKLQNVNVKFFDIAVGRESHYSDIMIRRRQEKAQRQEIERQKQINSKQEQIRKLQEEIDNIR